MSDGRKVPNKRFAKKTKFWKEDQSTCKTQISQSDCRINEHHNLFNNYQGS